MEIQIITIYCLLDDYIHSIGHKDWSNVKLTTAEIMLINIVAMRFFYGNIDTALKFLIGHRYIKRNFTKSAFNKRLHKIPMEWWENILEFIQRINNYGNLPLEYIVDAFPVSVCRNIRIKNCRIYQGEDFRGFNFSKREWFYGIKVTVITSREGCPCRVILSPGKEHDLIPFKYMPINLPEESKIYGDSAYLDYEYQDFLENNYKIKLIAEPKSNTKKAIELNDYVNLKHIRKFIEGAFGVISRLMPRKIHAVTQQGFEIKVIGFIIAFATNFIIK